MGRQQQASAALLSKMLVLVKGFDHWIKSHRRSELQDWWKMYISLSSVLTRVKLSQTQRKYSLCPLTLYISSYFKRQLEPCFTGYPPPYQKARPQASAKLYLGHKEFLSVPYLSCYTCGLNLHYPLQFITHFLISTPSRAFLQMKSSFTQQTTITQETDFHSSWFWRWPPHPRAIPCSQTLAWFRILSIPFWWALMWSVLGAGWQAGWGRAKAWNGKDCSWRGLVQLQSWPLKRKAVKADFISIGA